MEKTAKQTISLPKEAKNIRTDIVGTDIEISYDMEVNEPQSQEVSLEETKGTKEWLDKYFPVVHASTLSMNDEILKHEPETENQADVKERIVKAIKSGLQDFRAQRMDPSLDEDGNICYKAGMMPAVGKNAVWWEIKAKEFLPEKGSRLGLTEEERDAFLALFMKELMEECGYTISDAWKAVCDQSKDIGHYMDSKNANNDFEPTGSRKVGRWNDLGNTCKITKNKAGGFSAVGGGCDSFGGEYPLADVFRKFSPSINYDNCLGWLVLSV